MPTQVLSRAKQEGLDMNSKNSVDMPCVALGSLEPRSRDPASESITFALLLHAHDYLGCGHHSLLETVHQVRVGMAPCESPNSPG